MTLKSSRADTAEAKQNLCKECREQAIGIINQEYYCRDCYRLAVNVIRRENHKQLEREKKEREVEE